MLGQGGRGSRRAVAVSFRLLTSSPTILRLGGSLALPLHKAEGEPDEGSKTTVTLEQAVFKSIESRDGHKGGWTQCLDRLEELLATWRNL